MTVKEFKKYIIDTDGTHKLTAQAAIRTHQAQYANNVHISMDTLLTLLKELLCDETLNT